MHTLYPSLRRAPCHMPTLGCAFAPPVRVRPVKNPEVRACVNHSEVQCSAKRSSESH